MFISCKCLTLLPMHLFVAMVILSWLVLTLSNPQTCHGLLISIKSMPRLEGSLGYFTDVSIFVHLLHLSHYTSFIRPHLEYSPPWNMRPPPPPPSVVFLSIVFSVFLFLLHRNLAMRQVMSLLYLISLITEILTASVQKISLSEALTGFNKTITTLDDRRLLIGIGSNIEVRMLTHRHRRKILPN